MFDLFFRVGFIMFLVESVLFVALGILGLDICLHEGFSLSLSYYWRFFCVTPIHLASRHRRYFSPEFSDSILVVVSLYYVLLIYQMYK